MKMKTIIRGLTALSLAWLSVSVSTAQTTTICATAGEGGSLTLTAPTNSVIAGINFASYGLPNGSCGNFTIGSCHAASSMSVVTNLAVGQTTVTIPAANSIFGDPCVGTVKRLYIQATCTPINTFFQDMDGDGYGNPSVSQTGTTAPTGFVVNNTDCDDADTAEHPDQVWFIDGDGDLYATGVAVTQCTRPTNGFLPGELIATSGDCLDNNPAVYPGTRYLSLSGNPTFAGNICFPLQGTAATNFSFEIIYTDSSNLLPPAFYPRVVLDFEGNGVFNNSNDRTIIMTEADPADQTTLDGKRYLATVNNLPLGSFWQTRVLVSEGSCNTTIGPFSYPDVLVQPDLELFANDITFSSGNPAVSSPLTVTAVIHNPSDFTVQNTVAHLVNQFDSAIIYPDITVSNIAPNGTATVSWNITTPSVPAWCPMEVIVDYTDVVTETNELNNSAIRPFINGNFNLPGSIEVQAAVTPFSSAVSNGSLYLAGQAHYSGTAVQLTDSSVAGATVTFTVVETGASYTTFTNSNGYFSQGFAAPLLAGTYHIQGTITDFTLTRTFNATFIRTGCILPDLVSDLVITAGAPQSSHVTILQGTTLKGYFKVSNAGSGAAGATMLSVSNSGGQPALSNIATPSLTPGASVVDSFSLLFNTPGNYSVCINADANGQEAECGESNARCLQVTVLPAQPDIVPFGGPYGGHQLCNGATNLNFLLRNTGGAATGSFDCSVLVKLDGNTVSTLGHAIVNIPPQSNVGFSLPYTFPSAGAYTFELSCDIPLPNGSVAEVSELNNTASYGMTVSQCKPNLVIGSCESFDVLPVDPQFPGNVTYLTTIANNGNATVAAPFTVRFSQSGGTFYDVQHNTDLLPGQTATVTTTVPSVQPGTQSLTAKADPDNIIIEANESDNSVTNNLCWEFQPVPKCISNFWEGTYSVNQAITLSVGVAQSGLYDASLLKVRFQVSGPGIVGTVNLGDALINNLEQTCSCPHVAVLPNSFAFQQQGLYTFTMTTDPDGVYAECNEGNNVLVKTVQVGNLPDMRILSQHIAPSKLNPEPNESIEFNVSYENIGQSNIADQMKLKVLVDDIPFDSIVNAGGLITNGTTTFNIPNLWSSGLVGVHVIRAIIDADNTVGETNELNNEATRAVVVGEAANLYFQSFAADNPVPQFDENIEIQARIGNNGDLACEADVAVFFLNSQLDTIQLGVVHVNVPANDSVDIEIPWTVEDASTVLIGRIINAASLEFTYDDNSASTKIGTAPTVSFTSTPACTGTSAGTLTAVITGGKAPFTFTWSNNQSSQTITDSSGSYTIIVTDVLNRKDTLTGVIADTNCTVSCPATITASGPTIICPSDNVTLVASAGDSYLWSTGAVTQSITVSQSGTYHVVVTSGACAASDTMAVNAKTIPAVYIKNQSALTFCDGKGVVLYLFLPADTAGYSFQWNKEGNPIPGANAATYEATTAGSYSLTLTLGSCSRTSAAKTVTVKPVPEASFTASGPLSLCPGASVTLNADVHPGEGYKWLKDGLQSGTGVTRVVKVAGSYMLVANLSGCSDTSAPVTVSVSTPPAAPVITPALIKVCQGDQGTLSGPAGYDYQWYDLSGPIPGANSQTYSSATAASVRLVISEDGCASPKSAVAKVVINPLPLATFYVRRVNGNGSMLLTAHQTSAVYTWYRDGDEIPGATAINLTITQSGTYALKATKTTTGCSTMSSDTSITVVYNPLKDDGSYPGTEGDNAAVESGTGVQPFVGHHEAVNSISVYPNPSTGVFKISSHRSLNATVRDMQGRLILERSEVLEIDLNHQANGMYLLQLFDSEGRLAESFRLIKQ